VTGGNKGAWNGWACPDLERIAAHAEGRLGGDEAARMDEHLASCPRCYAVFAGTLRLAIEEDEAGPVAKRPETDLPFLQRPGLRRAAALAAVAAALVLGILLWRHYSGSPTSEERVARVEPPAAGMAEPAAPGPQEPVLGASDEARLDAKREAASAGGAGARGRRAPSPRPPEAQTEEPAGPPRSAEAPAARPDVPPAPPQPPRASNLPLPTEEPGKAPGETPTTAGLAGLREQATKAIQSAEALLSQKRGSVASDVSGAVDAAVAEVRRAIKIGDAAAIIAAATSLTEATDELTLAGTYSEEVTVVSASRVEQKIVDAPATMSVITAAQLQTAPQQHVADVLRTVPGLNVIQTSARDFNLTARQATSTLATSTLVTVDGRSVYLDLLGFVLWDFVPSPTSGDIDQIEVVRGPASVVWGANAANGLVNFITKSPRQRPGLGLVLGTGLFNRDGGSRVTDGDGYQLNGGISYADALSDTWSYKLKAGYYFSDPYSRPVGTVPLDCHPLGVVPCRDATGAPVAGGFPIGGATYPADADAPGAFENQGTSQPKFELRVDQDLSGGGRLIYEAGYGGTAGLIHTGIGPFNLQRGSHLTWGRVSYNKGALRLGVFANLLDAQAPNLLVSDPDTLGPINLTFKTQTYDIELGNTNAMGSNSTITYGANYRRNNFDISLAQGPDRNEVGAYAHWEYFGSKFRFSAGARADKFGNLDKVVWSPRVSVMFKPTPDQSVRASYNKAFVAPSFIHNYLDQNIQFPAPVDLSPLTPALPPPLASLVPPPFLLTVNVFGNPDLREQSTDSYELAYNATFKDTTLSLAGYISTNDDSFNFTYLYPPGTPGYPAPTFYSPENPARGVTLATPDAPATPITLSPLLMGVLGQVPPELGGPILFPEKVATYLNLGSIRNKGIEASISHRFTDEVSFFANYSWQDAPSILEASPGQIPYPPNEVGLPPAHRFNAGFGYSGQRFFVNANVDYASRALWVDVLTAEYAGFTDPYASLNATLGVKLADGKVLLALKGTNLANQRIQQHIFGDLLKRSLVLELRFFSK